MSPPCVILSRIQQQNQPRWLTISFWRTTATPVAFSKCVRSLTVRALWSRAQPSGDSRVGSILALVTSSSHNRTMKEVRIAELKARLSEYLRAVRRGETIAVLDRETPVAQIVPVRDRATLRIRKPTIGTPRPNRVPLPRPSRLKIDVVQLLLEERQSHR